MLDCSKIEFNHELYSFPNENTHLIEFARIKFVSLFHRTIITIMSTLKNLLNFLVVGLLVFSGCEKKSGYDVEPNDFTGNEIVYNLFSTSEFNISGFVAFKEKIDGSLSVEVDLLNTSGSIYHPVHIHAGAVTDDGQLLSVLNPILGREGSSQTNLRSLMVNESTPFTMEALQNLNGSIRIHLDGGPGQDILLAAANIGANPSTMTNGAVICKDW